MEQNVKVATQIDTFYKASSSKFDVKAFVVLVSLLHRRGIGRKWELKVNFAALLRTDSAQFIQPIDLFLNLIYIAKNIIFSVFQWTCFGTLTRQKGWGTKLRNELLYVYQRTSYNSDTILVTITFCYMCINFFQNHFSPSRPNNAVYKNKETNWLNEMIKNCSV